MVALAVADERAARIAVLGANGFAKILHAGTRPGVISSKGIGPGLGTRSRIAPGSLARSASGVSPSRCSPNRLLSAMY
jgi:hypothetical protein